MNGTTSATQNQLNCSQPQVNGSNDWYRCFYRNATNANVSKYLSGNFVSKTAFDTLSELYNTLMKGWGETNQTLERTVTRLNTTEAALNTTQATLNTTQAALNTTQTKLDTTSKVFQDGCEDLAAMLKAGTEKGLIVPDNALTLDECAGEITNAVLEKMKAVAKLFGYVEGITEGSSYCLPAMVEYQKIAGNP